MKRSVIAALAAGTLLRIVQLATSLGSPDSLTWYQNVRLMEHVGVLPSYLHDPGLNHPPLSLALAYFAHVIGSSFGLDFPDSFRLLQTLADVITTLALARIGKEYAATFFALSPAAIFISGFHCQSDPTMIMFVVLAVLAAIEKRPELAGIAIGCATGIKIIGLVALPLIALTFLWRALPRYLIAAILTITVIFLPAVIVTGPVVLKQVFGYTGPSAGWGLILLLGRRARFGLVLTLLASLALLWFAELRVRISNTSPSPALRAPSPRVAGRGGMVVGVAYCIVLLFAPGFGVQYLMWSLPFLALMVDRRVALAVHGVISLWLFAVYTKWCGGWPWWFGTEKTGPEVVRAGLLVWIALGVTVLLTLRSLYRRHSSSSSSAPALLYFLVLL